MEKIGEILCKLNGILWGDFYVFLVTLICIYLSAKCDFIQLKLFKIIKEFISALKSKEKRKAVSTALAASMGTGNIIGTAAAIGLGGEGAIFWMIMTSLLGMGAAYSENYLGVVYREKNKNMPAPMAYIKDIPFGKFLSVIYMISCIMAAYLMGNMIQGNAACTVTADFLHIDIKISAVIFAFAAGIIILGGRERIKEAAGKIIPVISVLYLVFCVMGLAVNHSEIGEAVKKIFVSAFSFKAMSGGIFGGAVSVGLRRGIFSNEAGMGSSVLVHSEAGSTDPDETGKWAAFEVFFDTCICCTLTALLIISSNVSYNESGIYEAFGKIFGKAGEIFIAVSIVIFALSSMLGWCCYGETALMGLCADKCVSTAYRILHIVFLYIGGVTQMKLLWQTADICDFLMLTINIFAVVIGMSRLKSKNKKG